MTYDEIEAEARYRLEAAFDQVGIDNPTEHFSEAELRKMLAEERHRLIEQEVRYGVY